MSSDRPVRQDETNSEKESNESGTERWIAERSERKRSGQSRLGVLDPGLIYIDIPGRARGTFAEPPPSMVSIASVGGFAKNQEMEMDGKKEVVE